MKKIFLFLHSIKPKQNEFFIFMAAKKLNVALLAGGYSGEYVISVQSAGVAERFLDAKKYNVYKIVITKAHWVYSENDVHWEVNRADFSLKIGKKKPIKFDVALIIIHGTPGEDGKLQGYLDMLDIPYTTCDAVTSALTFNKRWTVATAAFSGINVAKSVHLFKSQALPQKEISALQYPVFVKPNNGGSSIGMSKVDDAKDLTKAIEKAFKEDDQVLLEEFIAGREFTIGVFGTTKEVIVLPIIEIRTTNHFFDFEAKYKGVSEEIIPAPIDEAQANVLRDAARKVYAVFNCKGAVRIDFIWNDATQKPFMLEINTVPGQTEASLLPQMIKEYGWTMPQFYDTLIETALVNNSKN